MTSPEPAPPADPTSYRRRGFGFGFWALMVLCLLCIAGGVFIARFVPRLFPAESKAVSAQPAVAGKPSGSEPAEAAAETPAPPPVAVLPPVTVSGGGADVAGLKARIERLEQGQAATVQAASTALATAALLEAAQTSRPFPTELSQVERLLPESPDVAALRDLAHSGAPTRAILAADYSDAASAAIAAASKPGEKASLLQHIRYAVASIVTVRRVGQAKGKGADAVLARAELQVQGGDLEGALNELSALPPAAREAMKTWTDRARSRVEIDRRLAAIRAASMRALSVAEAGRA